MPRQTWWTRKVFSSFMEKFYTGYRMVSYISLWKYCSWRTYKKKNKLMSSSNFLLLIFVGTMNANWHSIGFISRLKKFSKHLLYKKTSIQTGYLELMDIPGVSEEQLYHQMCEAFPAILSLVIKKKKRKNFPGFISGDYKFFLHDSITETYLSMPP